MAHLYADEDFHYQVVELLRTFGHDVLTAQEAGQGGQGIDDPDVLNFAIARGRAVLTFNRKHFIRLHRLVRPHAGIVVCTRDNDLPALASRIDQTLGSCPNLANQLLRVVRPPRP